MEIISGPRVPISGVAMYQLNCMEAPGRSAECPSTVFHRVLGHVTPETLEILNRNVTICGRVPAFPVLLNLATGQERLGQVQKVKDLRPAATPTGPCTTMHSSFPLLPCTSRTRSPLYAHTANSTHLQTTGRGKDLPAVQPSQRWIANTSGDTKLETPGRRASSTQQLYRSEIVGMLERNHSECNWLR